MSRAKLEDPKGKDELVTHPKRCQMNFCSRHVLTPALENDTGFQPCLRLKKDNLGDNQPQKRYMVMQHSGQTLLLPAAQVPARDASGAVQRSAAPVSLVSGEVFSPKLLIWSFGVRSSTVSFRKMNQFLVNHFHCERFGALAAPRSVLVTRSAASPDLMPVKRDASDMSQVR